MFGHIVPCGIVDKAVTSLAAEGVDVSMARRGRRRRRRGPPTRGATAPVERQDVAWRHRPEDLSPFSRGAGPGVTARARRLAAPARSAGPGRRHRRACRSRPASRTGCGPRSTMGPRYLRLEADDARARARHRVRGRRLPEPLRVLGRRHGHVHDHRRALHPGVRLLPRRHAKPLARRRRRAGAGGRGGRPHGPRPRRRHDGRPRRPAPTAAPRPFAATIRGHPPAPAGRGGRGADPRLQGRRRPRSTSIFAARPDVLNHNLETVARLQRAVRPSAGYARSLARAGPGQGRPGSRPSRASSSAWARPTTRSSAPLADLAGVGVDIVTLGQYLRPTTHHLPVARWVPPDDVRPAARRSARRSASATSRPRPLTRSQLPRQAGRGPRGHDRRAPGPGRRPQLRLTQRASLRLGHVRRHRVSSSLTRAAGWAADGTPGRGRSIAR